MNPLARPKPSLKKTKQLLNRLTLGLVSVLGFFSTASILTAPSSLNPTETTSETIFAGRQPASVVKNDFSNSPERKGIQVIKLSCDAEMNLVEENNQIRLRGKVCSEKPVSIEKSSVKNSENEEIATVFHKEKTFTTDVIHLRPGQNRLVITNVLSDGSTSTQVLVVQRSPSGKKTN